MKRLISLAIDPSNSFNQKFLLQVMVQICKQLKPHATNFLKDLEDDDSQEVKKFDPESVQGKQTLIFLKLMQKHALIYNLLSIITTADTFDLNEPVIIDQCNQVVVKFGVTRIRCLELLNQIFSLLHPSNGVLASAQYILEGETNPDD